MTKKKVIEPPVEFYAVGAEGTYILKSKKFYEAYKKYETALSGLDQNKIDRSITHKRYIIKNNISVFWSLKDFAQYDKRFKTKSGYYFQNEARDIKLEFRPITKFNKEYGHSKFLLQIESSFFIGITHINNVELVVAYAMYRANPDWGTKLGEQIGEPFYRTEKLTWRDVKDATTTIATTTGMELSPLSRFFT